MESWEDGLPPRARSRLAAVGEAGLQEKDSLKEKEIVRSLLALFYRGDLDSDALCLKLRGRTPAMIREAQHSLIDSLSLGYSSRGFDQRREAILGLEGLKGDPRNSAIEASLKRIGDLEALYRESHDRVLRELTQKRERHLEDVAMRRRWMSGWGALSADSEVTERLAESLLEAEREYGGEFAMLICQLKRQVEGCD